MIKLYRVIIMSRDNFTDAAIKVADNLNIKIMYSKPVVLTVR